MAHDLPTAPYTIPDWTRGAGISPSSFFNIVLADRPRTAHVGRRVLIIEEPLDWLRRMQAQGGARTVKHQRKTPRSPTRNARQKQDVALLAAKPVRRGKPRG